jgi:hypothetical protein
MRRCRGRNSECGLVFPLPRTIQSPFFVARCTPLQPLRLLLRDSRPKLVSPNWLELILLSPQQIPLHALPHPNLHLARGHQLVRPRHDRLGRRSNRLDRPRLHRQRVLLEHDPERQCHVCERGECQRRDDWVGVYGCGCGSGAGEWAERGIVDFTPPIRG